MTAQLTALAPWLSAGFVVLAALIALRRPLRRLFRLALRWLGGLAALSLLSPMGAYIGVTLGVNPVNALVLGTLGIPGVGLLLLLQWMFRAG